MSESYGIPVPGYSAPWGGEVHSVHRTGLISALVLALGLHAGASWAEDEQYSPTIKAALLASPKISTTVQLNDGRTLSYRDLVEMPESQQDQALESVKPSVRERFRDFEAEVISPINAEIKKRTAAINAENAELDKRLAAIKAEAVEIEKGKAVALAGLTKQAEIYVKSVENGTKAWKSYLIKLDEFGGLPDSLQRRIRALLDNKNIQWRTDQP